MPETGFRLADQTYDPAIPVDSIGEHPENPNEGDVGAISESLDEHGFYGAVIVQVSSRYILAGNHRHRTAVLKGAATIPGFWLDVDDDEARRILAVDNRTTHLATFDTAKLVSLLVNIAHQPRALKGTGYDGNDLDDLVQMLNPPDLGDLGGGGGGPGEDDLWPVLRFKVSPETRDRFYEVTDAADGKDDTARFCWLLDRDAAPA